MGAVTNSTESIPRVLYRMMHHRKRFAPLRGKPLMVHVCVNVEYWPFDQPMPRAVMPSPATDFESAASTVSPQGPLAGAPS